MDKELKGKNKGFITIIICFCIALLLLVAVGFFVFSNREKEVIEKEKHGGNVTLNYTSNIKGLNIVNATPTTNAVGIAITDENQVFDFSIKIDLDKAKSLEYEVYITKKKNESTITDDDIRIYLEKEKSGTYTKVLEPTKFQALKEDSKIGSKKESMIITKEKKIKSDVDNYRLRMWQAENSLIQNGSYSIEVHVVGKAK